MSRDEAYLQPCDSTNEDTERMDWLEKHTGDINWDAGGFEMSYRPSWDIAKGKTLREAVDRAMHPENFV